MTRPGLAAVNSPSATGWLLIVAVRGLEVKGIGPSAFEELIGSREQEPVRTTITASLGMIRTHDLISVAGRGRRIT